MIEDDLRKFDKEVLVRFLSEHSMYFRNLRSDLKRIDRNIKWEKFSQQQSELLKEMASYDGLEDYEKWNAAHKKFNRLQKKIMNLYD